MSQKYEESGKKKHRKGFVILCVVFIILFFTCGIVLGTAYYILGGLTTTKIPKDNKSLGISTEAKSNNDIINIALFGVDSRENDDEGRSDAMIILTVDNKHDKIKMTSLLRDSRVAIDGYGHTKLNHAYAYGGPTLAIKTINQNFDTDIKEYATVNFGQLANIVDAVGGVTLTLTAAEVQSANGNLQVDAPDSPLITGSGQMELTGDQAVAYARIRDIDTDNARAGRQQLVLSQILEKVKGMSKTEYPVFIHKFLSTVETSLDYADLIGISPIMLNSNLQFEQNTIPDAQYENLSGGTASDGVWYWTYDLGEAADRLHTIIYEDEV